MHHRHKKNTIGFLELIIKLALFLFAAALVVYIVILLDVFGESFKRYFLVTDRYGDLVIFTLAFLAVTYVLKKLLVIFWRMEFSK
ncbi:MAG: hypothetical protein Q7K42_04385 [Candidatus Diapherotrites archaeon]|nr:hypothetical protein [Candidatus Diapherotrites archaeon]